MNAITTDDADRVGTEQSDSRSPISTSRREQWRVVAAAVVVSFLTILARAGISGAKADMARDLQINDVAFGVVFGAFAWATPFLWSPGDCWRIDWVRGNLVP
jgi:hypothetical protein